MEVAGIAAFALGAAVATFFAPCSYALLPGYVAYYVAATEGKRAPLGGALIRGIAATTGVFATFGILVGMVIIAGEAIERLLPVIEPVVGVALIVAGIYILSAGSVSFHVQLPRRSATVLGFGLFGAAYALAATACVLPLFLAIILQSLTMSAVATAIVFAAYVGGFGVLMLAVTVATAVGYEIGAGRVAAHSELLTKLAGVVLILAGSGQLYVAVTYTY